MKIVIRGERNTGKTVLFHRLQDVRPTPGEYIPTPCLQATSIDWTYRSLPCWHSGLSFLVAPGSPDLVKMELWDVVDKGISKSDSSLRAPPCVSP